MVTERIKNELIEMIGGNIPILNDDDLNGQIIRLCRQASVQFHKALHMVLRSIWIEHCIDKSNLTAGHMDGIEDGLEKGFKPNTSALYRDFEVNAAGWLDSNGYDRVLYELLVNEMVALRLYLYATESQEVVKFIANAVKSDQIIKNEPKKELVDQIISTKERWLRYQDELGERLLYLEAIRLKNANINRKWLKVFGAEYMHFAEEESRLELSRRRQLLLDMDPKTTEDELEDKLRQMLEKERRRLASLSLEISVSQLPDIEKMGGAQLDTESFKLYHQDSKKVLRDIYLLIHPDMLSQNASFKDLTDKQKTDLKTLWNEVMSLKESEVGYETDCLGCHYRSIPLLMDKLDLIKTILKNAGLDIDPKLIICGETISEQIEWLEKSIELLEIGILNAQAELRVLLEDRETREREMMLGLPESRQLEIVSQYGRKAEEYREAANKIEVMIKERLLEHAQ